MGFDDLLIIMTEMSRLGLGDLESDTWESRSDHPVPVVAIVSPNLSADTSGNATQQKPKNTESEVNFDDLASDVFEWDEPRRRTSSFHAWKGKFSRTKRPRKTIPALMRDCKAAVA